VSVQETAVKEHPLETAAASAPVRASLFGPILLFILGFVALYGFFWWLQRTLIYLSTGSDLIYHAKLADVARGNIFPRETSATKIVVFGNSTILAGLNSKSFDESAHADGLNTYTYNSGFPGHSEFVPQIKELVDSGHAPDIVLLTKQWQPKRASGGFFKLPWTDQEIANAIFPFRTFVRDAASFAATSRHRGGLRAFYEKSRENITEMRQNQGYYFISEQSRYPNEQLPDDFHMPDDKPNVAAYREADPASPEIAELDAMLMAHSIKCFYVPGPARASGMGEPAPTDVAFRQLVESRTPCKLLGPDYYRYPNRDFSDQTHLNHIGSRIYTADLYRLVKPYLVKDAR
jgi:hypothetical protein